MRSFNSVKVPLSIFVISRIPFNQNQQVTRLASDFFRAFFLFAADVPKCSHS